MLKTPITLTDLRTLPVGEIMNLSPAALLLLQKEATEAFELAKLTKEWLENAIRLKYDTRFQALRQQQDKPFGTVHLDDDGCTVTCDVPKKPEWDQQKLAAVVHQISAAGDNPSEYVDVTYKVAERKFTAWPEHIRQAHGNTDAAVSAFKNDDFFGRDSTYALEIYYPDVLSKVSIMHLALS